MKRYDSRIERVEAQITSKLRDRLATAKNANEMFRVFSKFNALFFRPRVLPCSLLSQILTHTID